MRDCLLRMLAGHHAAIGTCVRAGGVNVEEVFHSPKWINLPAKEFVVELFGSPKVIGRNFEPDDV